MGVESQKSEVGGGLKGWNPAVSQEQIRLTVQDAGSSLDNWVCLLSSFLGLGQRDCANIFTALKHGFPGKNLDQCPQHHGSSYFLLAM